MSRWIGEVCGNLGVLGTEDEESVLWMWWKNSLFDEMMVKCAEAQDVR